MILRGIHVEHWCCIASLQLEDLPEGIIILHGPNRTGKSSLVKALRGCLFDFDHDTTRADFRSCLPSSGAGPPLVSVEFETQGEVYRLSKAFSKRSDGYSKLERKTGGGWSLMEGSPKEATRRVRELLGADRSDQGLNQLLWLDQGVMTLPDARKLDASLEKQLANVLGVMVTASDLGFKQALDKRYSRWFGVRGEHRPTSPVTELQNQRQERLKNLAELQTKLRDVEQTIRDLDDCQNALPQAQTDLAAARLELARLQQEQERSHERRKQYECAQRDCQAAEHQAAAARQRLDDWQAAKGRWQAAESATAQANAVREAALRDRDRLAAERTAGEQALQAARRTEEEHRLARDELDDRKELLRLARQIDRVENDLERARQLQDAVAALRQQLHEQPAPDRQSLEALRGNRQAADTLRAQLQAEALTLSLACKDSTGVKLRLDQAVPESVNLTPAEQAHWSFRQKVEVELAELGVIRVARSHEHVDLERAAQRLAKLDCEYGDTLRVFGEQPDDDCLNRLTERRVRHEANLSKLEAAQRELQQLAPHGLGLFEQELRKATGQRQTVVGRQPDLASWRPAEEEVAGLEHSFQARAADLQKARVTLEQSVKRAALAQDKADQCYRAASEDAVVACTAAKYAREEFERQGEESSLQTALAQGGEALAAARRRLQEAELTEEEKNIDQRCRDAENAAQVRADRCVALQAELERFRGRLEGSEGLHPRLADAEAAVLEIQEAIAREELEATAHRRLHDLFEECRDSQVQQVMGPIAERVLSWTRALGLDDYREVRFGDRFLPESLIAGAGETDRPRTLEEESYGTVEQLAILVRLALGGVLARKEPVTAILDDPLAHADAAKHRRMLDVIRLAAEGNASWIPPAGGLQILIFTCHPERFDHLPGASQIDLVKLITREI